MSGDWSSDVCSSDLSEEIRKIMYTTNILEGLNRQYRKVTKTKSVFPSDQSLEKMLYLASENITKESILWDVFILVQKNQVIMNKESCGGYTINRKNIRHQEIHEIDSKILHIELLSRNLKIL